MMYVGNVLEHLVDCRVDMVLLMKPHDGIAFNAILIIYIGKRGIYGGIH